MPRELPQFSHFFCGDPSNPDDLKSNEEKRVTFYKLTVALIRAYNNLAPEMSEAGYNPQQAANIKSRVTYYTELRNTIKQKSGDYIDMKKYEPDMRQMLDMYLTADPSRVISNLGEATLLQLIVEHGLAVATEKLPPDIKNSKEAMAETIENNMRKKIIQEMPVNPAYYEKMSILLLELIRLRKEAAISYEELLKQYEDLAHKVQPEEQKSNYPTQINTQAKQALYDNLMENETLSVVLDDAIKYGKHDSWEGNIMKEKHLKQQVIKPILEQHDAAVQLDAIFEIVKKQRDYQ
jgi:type I restriction enzyme R subunit